MKAVYTVSLLRIKIINSCLAEIWNCEAHHDKFRFSRCRSVVFWPLTPSMLGISEFAIFSPIVLR